MLTEKDYCDYDTCVALKELGYVGSSRYYYTQRDRKFHYDAYNKFYTVRTADAMGYVLAIHLYDAQKWLREKKQIAVFVTYDKNTSKWFATVINMDSLETINMARCDLYEETLSEGILDAVEILKENEAIHR